MLLELDCPEGYVCRLSCGNIYKVADSIITHTTETLPPIEVTWRAKGILVCLFTIYIVLPTIYSLAYMNALVDEYLIEYILYSI